MKVLSKNQLIGIKAGHTVSAVSICNSSIGEKDARSQEADDQKL